MLLYFSWIKIVILLEFIINMQLEIWKNIWKINLNYFIYQYIDIYSYI
jgi:hypothetical protein